MCNVDPSCQGTIPFMLFAFISIAMVTGQASDNDLQNYTAPGLIQGCYMIDTLRLSTLECFYADTVCFGNVLRAVNVSLSHFHMNLSQLNIRPLLQNEVLTHFPPQTPLSLIIDQMMIERWNISINFDQYYHTCQPTYCTYPYTMRDRNYLAIITSLISLVGGLSSALRWTIPWLVKLAFRIFESKRNKTRSGIDASVILPITPVSWLSHSSSSNMVATIARCKEKYDHPFIWKIDKSKYVSCSKLSQSSSSQYDEEAGTVEYSTTFPAFGYLSLLPRVLHGDSTRTINQNLFHTFSRSIHPAR